MAARRGGARPAAEDRFAAMGRVMGELVHDLGNELTVLHGWSLLARGEQESGRMGAAEVERVAELSAELGEMLRDMVEVVGGQRVSPEVCFAPAEVTEAVVAKRVLQLSDRVVRLHTRVPEGVVVRGRRSFLTRAVGNLLGNAARHARSQVLVTVGVAGEGAERVATVRVEDDGAGVAPADRASIFQPLWRGAQGRTGLGLSSAVWAVDQLGGTLSYLGEGALGGAVFEIRLPVAAPLAAPAAAPPGAVAEALRGASIALVDDDALVRGAVARLLARHDAAVEEVGVEAGARGADAVLRALARAAPEVVVMDLRLGELTGVALWERMCLEMPPLAARVVFATGAAPGDPDWEAAQLTGQPVLAKPFELTELAALVRRLRVEG